ncbi:hypothetical protein QLQ12_24660 [Actinoplanes sp. NEAU-A12]|uniref:Uncharacterized protein n=1 Tax=Actinoplanes sandaracinus TaxID=3045177 RepID=A0ABT6WQ62_9ACTN|nr:hypothetical protein [Actinoplanes sandaracinus]MDI6101819.1 hypothetical protein [Actinoplanes sandaracinus]
MAPTPSEVTAVTFWMVTVIMAPLGLTAGLALLRRGRGPAAPPPVRRSAGGLWTLAALGIGALVLGGTLDFLEAGSAGGLSLMAMHGTGTPVYWPAYALGATMLTILTLTLVPRRDTWRFVAGVPALVAGGLLMGLLLLLYGRIQQLDGRLAAEFLPTVAPTGDLSAGGPAWRVSGGWVLAFAGTFLLLLVAALIVAGPYELVLAGALAVTAALAAARATPDLSSFWAVRDGKVERVDFSPFDIGGVSLLWPAALAVAVALMCAIPFLPHGLRGPATIVAAVAPGWIVLAAHPAYVHAKAVLPGMLSAEGFTVSQERMAVFTYIFLVMAVVAIPVVAVRLRRAARRGARWPWAPAGPA